MISFAVAPVRAACPANPSESRAGLGCRDPTARALWPRREEGYRARTMSTVVSPGTLRVADLPPLQREWLLQQRYDHFVEKHEGPFGWDDLIAPKPFERPDGRGGREMFLPEAADFVRFDEHEVLLPIGRDHHPNLRRLRVVVGDQGRSLTLFLTDFTWDQGYSAGRLAFCEKAPAGEWFVCSVWHAWYAPR